MSARPAARVSTVTASSSFEPQERGKGYEFVDKIVGGSIPREFIAPIDAGHPGSDGGWRHAGYPIVDIKATLVDGSYHDVDSKEVAFKIAGSLALKEAVRRGKPVDPRADHAGRSHHA